MRPPSSLAIIVPVCNERETLGRVLADIHAAGLGDTELVVVDDGSTDGSGELARIHGARVVRHDRQRGYGAALAAGLRASSAATVAIIDGDATYSAEDLAALTRELPPGGMAVGARRDPCRLKRTFKALFRLQVRLLTGRRVPELNSGLRVFDRRLPERLSEHLPERFSFTTTLTLGALALGVPVRFAPIGYRARQAGRSKFTPADVLRMGRTVSRGCGWIRRGSVQPPARSVLSWAGFALALAVLVALLPDSGWRSLGLPCALGALLYLPFFAFKVLRWRRLLALSGVELGWREASEAYLSGLALGAVTPGRAGELVRIAGPASRGHSADALVATTLVDRMLDLAVLGAVALGTFFVTALPASSWLVVAAAVTLGAAGLVCTTPSIVTFLARYVLRRPLARPLELGPAALLEAAGWTLASMLIFFAIASGLLLSAGIDAPLWLLPAAVAFGNLASIVPVSVAGLGTREGAMATVLLAAGVAVNPAALASYSLAFHAVFTLTPWLLVVAFCVAFDTSPSLSRVEA